MAHARTYARIETPNGELTLSKRAFEELRMVLGDAQQRGDWPDPDPPGHFEETVGQCYAFMLDTVSGEYVDGGRPDL